MQVIGGVSKSIPFPKRGFQKYDVITPKGKGYGREQYVVLDYQRTEWEDGRITYTYVLNYNRKVYESDLSGYEKLYSKRKEIAFNILESSEYHIRGFSKIIDRIKDLDIDVTPFTDNLEKLKMLLESLNDIK